jgi:hypothetical protein
MAIGRPEMSYSDRYYCEEHVLSDSALAKWSPAAVSEKRLQDLADLYLAFTFAGSIPRRLGSDVTPSELSHDKKQIRKICHLLYRAVRDWARICGVDADAAVLGEEPTEESKMMAAQVIVTDWAKDRHDLLQREILEVCTAGIQAGQARWANKAANALEQEIRGLERVLSR